MKVNECQDRFLPGPIGVFVCGLAVVAVVILTFDRDVDDDIGLELSPVSIASTDAPPG